ncbi:MAG: hypothetical protein HY675_12020 [Chloroflexi bacterium]|nr:hypothetical protein [Chloroflexota bacterium]
MDGSKGFAHSPSADINLIRDNLRDRYHDGFPIIKELVQNADDAGATVIDFGLADGIPSAEHPLLRGPALFVVNNGRFSQKDARAIRQMGLSNRAAEKSSIGKFGLGLKSIFHLCEAFFYLSSDESQEGQSVSHFSRSDVLNPWSGDSDPRIHSDWDGFSESDQKLAVGLLKRILPDTRWFVLWIPLRRAAHCHGYEPIIRNFPGDERELPLSIFIGNQRINNDLGSQLANLLPLLRTTRGIRLWLPQGSRRELQEMLSIDLAGQGRRWTHETRLPSGRSPMAGYVTITTRNTAARKLSFGGFEALKANPILNELSRSSFWPRWSTIDETTGRSVDVPEKAEPHCAVVFSAHRISGQADLTINRAVFLPIGESEEAIPIAGRTSYFLTLHGHFFLDSGRTRVDLDLPDDSNEPKDERSVQRRWNQVLYDEGTLRLLLPALDSFVRETPLESDSAANLTDAISKSKTFKQKRDSICSESNWVLKLAPHGRSWSLQDRGLPILGLPSVPAHASNRPFEVFSALEKICQIHCIVMNDSPRLSTSDKLDDWPEDLLLQMLNISVSGGFETGVRLEYLISFLENCSGGVLAASTVKTLQALARRAFATLDLRQLRGNRSFVQRFLNLLPSNKVFALAADVDTQNEDALKQLLQIPLNVVLVPRDFGQNQPEEPKQITVDDAARILTALAEPNSEWARNEGLANARVAIALQILGAVGEQKEELLRQCGHLKLFTGIDCSASKSTTLSLDALERCKRTKTLFIYQLQPAQRGLADDLQKALLDARVIVIRFDIARGLYGEQQVVSCTPNACVEVLLQGHLLAPPEQRALLLGGLSPNGQSAIGDELRKAMRYLLHGQSQHIQVDGPLLIEREGHQHSVWSKLATLALGKSEAEWRVVKACLADRLSRFACQELDLQEIDSDTVVELLRAVEVEEIDCATLTSSERDDALRGIADVGILQRLKVHEDLDGNLVSIAEKTFLQSNYRLNSALLSEITVIRRNNDVGLAAIQGRITPILDAQSVIKIALGTEHPSDHWQLIMDALFEVASTNVALRDEVIQDLKQVAWILLDNGETVSPENIIYLPGIEDEVARVVAHTRGAFCDVLRLPAGFREHPAFQHLASLAFPGTEDALSMLGTIMVENEGYRLGFLDKEKFDLNVFLEVFRDGSPSLMPSWGIINGVYQTISLDDCETYLVPKLFADIPVSRTSAILKHLSDKHRSSIRSKASSFLEVHNWYLASAVRSGSLETILSKVSLLSRSGSWKTTRQLALAADGIDEDDLLDKLQADIVEEVVKTFHIRNDELQSTERGPIASNYGGQPDWGHQVETGGKRLRQYFSHWRGAVSGEVVGGFLSLLGDHPSVRTLASEYLGNRSVEATRDLFEWKPLEGMIGGAGEDVHAVMEKQYFLVEINQASNIAVRNLLGERFEARTSGQFEHLLLGDPPWRNVLKYTGYRVKCLTLRQLEPDRYTEEQLSEFLKQSSRIVLDRAYLQKAPNLEQVWQELFNSEQLDIQIAQNMLLNDAFFYLRQLGVHSNEAIGRVLGEWDTARRRKAEEEQAQQFNRPMRDRTADKELNQAREKLRQLLDFDAESQVVILQAIRDRMSNHYQYTPESVPFELFQNADDAVAELYEMLGDGDQFDTQASRFVMVLEPNQVAIMHWGRPINQYAMGAFSGRSRGFDRDLEKMLVLSSSDKGIHGDDDNLLTGKFGLGFKSVLLVTDNPKVISGRLGFEVIAGVFPRRLVGAEFTRLVDRFRQFGLDSRGGTIFELPLNEQSCQSAVKGVQEFRRLSQLLLVFSRQIKQCDFCSYHNPPTSVSWTERPVPHVRGAYVGLLQPTEPEENDESTCLVLRHKTNVLLMTLGPRGFRPLSARIPTIWVTAPTTECHDLGFAINGMFAVDIGRAQLAKTSDQNRAIAREISLFVGNCFCELFDASANWESFKKALNLAADTTPYRFWDSLWEIVAISFNKKISEGNPHDTVRLAASMLWGDAGPQGVGIFVSSRAILPSRLWSDYAVLTKADKVKLFATGILDSEAVFRSISSWSTFRLKAPTGTIVSNKGTRAPMQRLRPDLLKECQSVDLCSVVNWEVGQSKRIEPSQARSLGAVVTSDLMAKLRQGNEMERGEQESLQEFLAQMCFRARDGSFHLPKELLVAHWNLTEEPRHRDEVARTLFAPESRILDPAYKGVALAFFDACRGQLLAHVVEISEWGRVAESDTKRKGLLRYLLEGDRGSLVAIELRKRLQGTWLEDLADSPLLSLFSPNEQSVLLGLLHLAHVEQPDFWPDLLDPKDVLPRIYDWWVAGGNSYIREYERNLYPGGTPPSLSDDTSCLTDDCELRQNWLVLFLLGATHTMGWAQPQQHREFLRLCKDRGWLQVFSEPRVDPEKWIWVMEEYLNRQVDDAQFYQWMKQFVGIFQISKWLNDYIESFLQIERTRNPFTLDQVIASRTSKLQQGGGIDAPPLTRALGIGSLFVVRELSRIGMLGNPFAHRHCYVPTRKVRGLLEMLGCPGMDTGPLPEQSIHIHSFLCEHLGPERAIFNGSFDLPLRAIAYDPDLQSEFLHEILPDEPIDIWGVRGAEG